MTNPLAAGPRGAYFAVNATEKLYKFCGEPADYKIPEEDRKLDKVAKLEDGEEVGVSIATQMVWHGRMFPPGLCVCPYEPKSIRQKADSDMWMQCSSYLRPSARGPT